MPEELTDLQAHKIAQVAIAWAKEIPREPFVKDEERRAARQIVNIGLSRARDAEKEAH